MRDIGFTDNGDFLLKENQVHIASEAGDEAFKQAILQRLQNKSSDWRLENSDLVSFYDLDIGSFIGSKITNSLIRAIKYFIVTSLSEDNFISPEDIVIYELPIDYNTLLLKLKIIKDGFSKREELFIDISYDLRSNRMIPKIINTPSDELWQN